MSLQYYQQMIPGRYVSAVCHYNTTQQMIPGRYVSAVCHYNTTQQMIPGRYVSAVSLQYYTTNDSR